MLYRGAHILILDEPTAVLVPQEVDELFHSLRELTDRRARRSIFISHKLDEVLKVADAITVIRAGKTVAEIDDPSTVTARDLAEMMVGSELPTPETPEVAPSPTRSSIRSDRSDPCRRGPRRCSTTSALTIHSGEIVGIAGVEGNGQANWSRRSSGSIVTGTIVLSGHDMHDDCRPRPTRRAGTRLHRRGSPQRRARPAVPAVGERGARPPDVTRRSRGDRGSTRAARVARTRRDHRRLRRAHPGSRRADLHAVGRQPAEADRRARDARRADDADRRTPDPRCRRRSPGVDLGHPPRRPRARARRCC